MELHQICKAGTWGLHKRAGAPEAVMTNKSALL